MFCPNVLVNEVLMAIDQVYFKNKNQVSVETPFNYNMRIRI